jgi:hypothetical protein
VALRVTNATDRPRTLAITLKPPPGLVMPETARRVELAAGAQAGVSFSIPRQVFRSSGICPIPYRVAVADGAAPAGELAANLRPQTRWWISRRIPTEPNLAAGAGPGGGDLGNLDEALGAGDIVADNNSIFKAKDRPKGWDPAVFGADIPFGNQGPLPSRGSAALAATRVAAPDERDAFINMRHELPHTPGRKFYYTVRVWFNGEVVYDTSLEGKARNKRFRVRKGANTMVVECRSDNDGAAGPGTLFATIADAPDGKGLENLVFDMEKR